MYSPSALMAVIYSVRSALFHSSFINQIMSTTFFVFTGVCSQEFVTFGDFYEHLDRFHSFDGGVRCRYCDVKVQRYDVKTHFESHRLYEFQCIYCKSFGANEVLTLKKHLAEKHPSKLSFVTSRYESIQNRSSKVTILYVGDMADHSSFHFYKLSSNVDLCDMDPSLYAHHTHSVKQNMPVEKVLHVNSLPQINFFDGCAEFFVNYNTYFPFQCIGMKKDGTKCTFNSRIERTMIRHRIHNHAQCIIEYRIQECKSRSENVTTIATCELECNVCKKQYVTRHEFDDHFTRTHPKCTLDASILQNFKVIKSTDPMEPINSQRKIQNRFLYCSYFTCTRDNKIRNTKAKMIEHYRVSRSSTDCLEFVMRSAIFDRDSTEWNTNELAEENQRFDRMIAYECYYCSTETRSVQSLFESVDELDKHRNETHTNWRLLYSARNLVACAECKKISTFDGIQNHFHRAHRTKSLALANPTNKLMCGVCSDLTSNHNELVKHYRMEHVTTGCSEMFDDQTFKYLHMNDQLGKAHFKPECCNQYQFTTISQAVHHVIQCENSNFHNLLQIEREVDDLLKSFRNMQIFLENGLIVTFSAIEFTSIGHEVKHKLINVFHGLFKNHKF